MTDLRENVARAIHEAWNISGIPYDSEHIKGNAFRDGKLEAQADAAIAAVIACLEREDLLAAYKAGVDAYYADHGLEPGDLLRADRADAMMMAGIQEVLNKGRDAAK